MKILEEQYLEKINLETRCLEKINNVLSKFNLQIFIIKVNQLNQRQYRLVYKNDIANWLALWLSISDMFFKRTIFEFLHSYYNIIYDSAFSTLNVHEDTMSRFLDCSDAYKEIASLKSNSFEEFLINCDLMGI